ncbi:exodeoxyribonuclease V subunit alpha [Roseisolibacter agri]|uniref:RecBCD enzyme subunit RecD n=1 Tax=Roseisolibacter agri TaxID=2014610 RepID=A0AA37QC85_9BACT|nr:exodeoxyribonuclease V subunit alpha [Roseisolibacter agri]GLC23610.1 RecBCD enzyme subunit RecD [Roseisolibacter agri]
MSVEADLFSSVAQPLDVGALDRRTGDRDAVPGLDELRAHGVLRDVDVHFARTVARLAGVHDPLVLLGLAVASRAPGAGHVCAELDAPERLVRMERAEAATPWPDAAAWRDALANSAVVVAAANAEAGTTCPLVLDGHRLYLARYWAYQRRLQAALRARAGVLRADVDERLLRDGLARLFPATEGSAPDLQRTAAAVAVLRALAVITGGPGTGKTTTVLAVLALLVEQALARGETPPRIALAAPTGKAAARLAESVVSGRARLALPPDVSTHVPAEATTLHRLLGWQPRTPTRFRHDATHPLPYDVVVVDESSMVDLALMAKLLDAVPSHARLVLLGDRDQLASVEAGTILADVCGDGDVPCSATFGAQLARVGAAAGTPAAGKLPAVADAVVRLRVSRRFHDDGGIGALARAINDGDAARALAVLEHDATGQVVWEPSDGGVDRAALAPVRRLALPAYRQSVMLDGPAAALAALDRFRVLAAHRAGTVGVAGLNGAIVEALAREGTLPRDAAGARWWHGQPVMVTENDHALELYNGDVGVVLRDGASGLRAWFRASDGGVRALAPARLPAHETVFAMTVHKSQGSEFDEVVLVLPPRPSPVLTRELLYTGVTRAKSKVTVVGSAEVLRAGIAERVQRASGLREALWG